MNKSKRTHRSTCKRKASLSSRRNFRIRRRSNKRKRTRHCSRNVTKRNTKRVSRLSHKARKYIGGNVNKLREGLTHHEKSNDCPNSSKAKAEDEAKAEKEATNCGWVKNLNKYELDLKNLNNQVLQNIQKNSVTHFTVEEIEKLKSVNQIVLCGTPYIAHWKSRDYLCFSNITLTINREEKNMNGDQYNEVILRYALRLILDAEEKAKLKAEEDEKARLATEAEEEKARLEAEAEEKAKSTAAGLESSSTATTDSDTQIQDVLEKATTIGEKEKESRHLRAENIAHLCGWTHRGNNYEIDLNKLKKQVEDEIVGGNYFTEEKYKEEVEKYFNDEDWDQSSSKWIKNNIIQSTNGNQMKEKLKEFIKADVIAPIIKINSPPLLHSLPLLPTQKEQIEKLYFDNDNVEEKMGKKSVNTTVQSLNTTVQSVRQPNNQVYNENIILYALSKTIQKERKKEINKD